MSQFSKEQNNKFPGVRLYDLNQSMLTPLWKGAGMPYIQIVHGSDTPYIFGGLFPEGEISEDDMRLANRITGALINFAYTGNPASDKEDNQWPEICGSASNGCAASDTKVHVLGGPHGDGAANIFDPYWNLEDMQEEFGFKIQMGDMAHMEAMKSPAYGKRNREIQREKLVARCEVINGLAERLGV